jgi:hypothetical protein
MGKTHRLLAVIVAGGLVAGAGAAVADPIHDPVKIDIPPVVDGTFDPLDPPLVAGVDPDVAALDVPAEHPWMLFSRQDLDQIRGRVLGADPSSVVGKGWAALRAKVDRCCDGRASLEDGIADVKARDYGRDDLAELGFVWQITGDDVYLEKAGQLLDYVVATAPDHGAPREPGVDEFYIQRAHRLNGFALAYDLLHPGFTPEQRAELLGVIAALGSQVYAHAHSAWWGTVSSGSNIGAVNAASLGMAGLAVWHDLPEGRAWAVRGEQLTRAYFHEGFDAEGAGLEGVLYGNYGMRVPTFLNHALTRAGHTVAGRRGIDGVGGVDRQQEWVAYEVLPGGGAVNPLNDARYYEFNPYFTAWSATHGDTAALSRWIYDEIKTKGPRAGGHGSIPEILWHQPSDPSFDPASMLPLAKHFPGRGLVHVRSGWSQGDLMASFESRQNDWGEGIHHNQDVNSFVLYADDANLVVDSRYANDGAQVESQQVNRLSEAAGQAPAEPTTSETQAHNALVVDGRSQDFHGEGDLKAFASTAAQVGETAGLDVALGDARRAYITDQPRRAERVFLHVRADRQGKVPDYVVVADRFQQDTAAHDHTWFLHTDWRNEMSVTAPGRVRVDAPNGAGLSITMHAAQQLDARVGAFTPSDANDWSHLPEPGRRTHDRLEVSSRGQAFESIAVLSPTSPGERAPVVTALPAAGGIALLVDHGAYQDVLLLATGDATSVSAGGVSTDGAFAMVRRSRGGKVSRATLVQGRRLEARGLPVLRLDAVGTAVSADGTVRLAR